MMIEDLPEIEIKGLFDFSSTDVINIITDYIIDMRDYIPEVEVIEINLFGSRINGKPHDDSDLDVLIYYIGDIAENDLFNFLNDDEDRLFIEGIHIDFFPIRVE